MPQECKLMKENCLLIQKMALLQKYIVEQCKPRLTQLKWCSENRSNYEHKIKHTQVTSMRRGYYKKVQLSFIISISVSTVSNLIL